MEKKKFWNSIPSHSLWKKLWTNELRDNCNLSPLLFFFGGGSRSGVMLYREDTPVTIFWPASTQQQCNCFSNYTEWPSGFSMMQITFCHSNNPPNAWAEEPSLLPACLQIQSLQGTMLSIDKRCNEIISFPSQLVLTYILWFFSIFCFPSVVPALNVLELGRLSPKWLTIFLKIKYMEDQ